MEKVKHPHAELIIQWAYMIAMGYPSNNLVQVYEHDWVDCDSPNWIHNKNYRVAVAWCKDNPVFFGDTLFDDCGNAHKIVDCALGCAVEGDLIFGLSTELTHYTWDLIFGLGTELTHYTWEKPAPKWRYVMEHEPVARIVSSGALNLPIMEWLSADHSFRVKIGDILYAIPPSVEALNALEAKNSALSARAFKAEAEYATILTHCRTLENEIEPLRRDVAMMRIKIKQMYDCLLDVGSGKGGWAWEEVAGEAARTILDTEETAEAHDREVSKKALDDAIHIADTARLRLSNTYAARIAAKTSDMGGNKDWARLEGAVAVVEALRRETKGE